MSTGGVPLCRRLAGPSVSRAAANWRCAPCFSPNRQSRLIRPVSSRTAIFHAVTALAAPRAKGAGVLEAGQAKARAAALCLAIRAARSIPSGSPSIDPPFARDHHPVGAMGAAEDKRRDRVLRAGEARLVEREEREVGLHARRDARRCRRARGSAPSPPSPSAARRRASPPRARSSGAAASANGARPPSCSTNRSRPSRRRRARSRRPPPRAPASGRPPCRTPCRRRRNGRR